MPRRTDKVTLAPGAWVRWNEQARHRLLCLEDSTPHDIPSGTLGQVAPAAIYGGLTLFFLLKGQFRTFPGMDHADVSLATPTEEELAQWTIAELSR